MKVRCDQFVKVNEAFMKQSSFIRRYNSGGQDSNPLQMHASGASQKLKLFERTDAIITTVERSVANFDAMN